MSVLKCFGFILLSVLFVSCSTDRYITVDNYVTDTVKVREIDYVTKYDSVFVLRENRGDTVYIVKDKYKYIDKCKTDTLYVTKQKIEYKTKLQKCNNHIKIFLIGMLIGSVLVFVIKLVLKFYIR